MIFKRVFFGMDVESDYFKEVKSARFEKFSMLASQNSFASNGRTLPVSSKIYVGKCFSRSKVPCF